MLKTLWTYEVQPSEPAAALYALLWKTALAHQIAALMPIVVKENVYIFLLLSQ